MTKRVSETVYHGGVACQGQQKSGKACEHGAYFRQGETFLCGVHSDKKLRQPLPRDRQEKQRRLTSLEEHRRACDAASTQRRERGEPGAVRCAKIGMMKGVPLVDGFLNVFPNNKHQNRVDGIGCAALSPMRLGPVVHRQPGLPDALNIENYHQFNKVWPNEVDAERNPLPCHSESKRAAYLDPVPHRHKCDVKEMAGLRKKVNGANRNQPLYSVHLALDGTERRFTYVQSRYFYCKAYEVLARRTEDFRRLAVLRFEGHNLIICGYDAYEVTRPLYDHYCDETRAFGHELALYALLTIADSDLYPWNLYRAAHPDVYDNIAHVVM